MNVPGTFHAILIGFCLVLVAPPGIFPAKDPTDKDAEYVDNNAVSSSKSNTKSTTPCPRWKSSNGCGRTPARTKPPPTTPNPNDKTTLPPTTRRPGGFKQPCNSIEENRAACLNEGKCFTLELMGERSAHCHCPEMYKGHRCEVIDSDIYGKVFSADKVEKAGIAAGVVAIIIIITVIIVYLVIKKRKKRRKRSAENGDANGHAGKLLANDPDNKGVNYNDIEMGEWKKKCLSRPSTEI
ncbi:unnamed protein product [Lymnaea stagnalis]|uniref:EGF-like domain-containing protein n=1 Tax=Lymnaea stagnalis TaxID=6523 RepID=A0AAV2IK40_LYMST